MTRTLLSRISRLELVVAGVVVLVLLVLVVIEPEILEAPVENGRTVAFTVGGTVLAAAALIGLLVLRVPPALRVLVLGAPFVAVNVWLLSPYFIEDEVQETFVTTIAEASDSTGGGAASASTPSAATPTGPVLLGSGELKGLAGHRGEGDAGVFRETDGGLVLRLENLDIQNGPDLEVYLVPGADRRSVAKGSIHLGRLRGNVGNLTYDLPDGTTLAAGPWTALIWCEAFSVEFTGATLTLP